MTANLDKVWPVDKISSWLGKLLGTMEMGTAKFVDTTYKCFNMAYMGRNTAAASLPTMKNHASGNRYTRYLNLIKSKRYTL